MAADKFKNRYRILSARAYWHDYSGGAYFVTICTANREHYFGKIVADKDEPQMILSEIGQCVVDTLQNVTQYYAYAEIPLYVVMPNHVHAIVIIDNHVDLVGGNAINRVTTGRNAINRVFTNDMETINGGITGKNNPMLGKCLGTVVRGIKARVTYYTHKNHIDFAWQKRFYDHIIRNQDEMNRIAYYIENNVIKWYLDCYAEQ